MNNLFVALAFFISLIALNFIKDNQSEKLLDLQKKESLEREKFSFRFGMKWGLAVGFYESNYGHSFIFNNKQSYFFNSNTAFIWERYRIMQDSVMRDTAYEMNTYWKFMETGELDKLIINGE